MTLSESMFEILIFVIGTPDDSIEVGSTTESYVALVASAMQDPGRESKGRNHSKRM
jgi:hypothetical protein